MSIDFSIIHKQLLTLLEKGPERTTAPEIQYAYDNAKSLVLVALKIEPKHHILFKQLLETVSSYYIDKPFIKGEMPKEIETEIYNIFTINHNEKVEKFKRNKK